MLFVKKIDFVFFSANRSEEKRNSSDHEELISKRKAHFRNSMYRSTLQFRYFYQTVQGKWLVNREFLSVGV